MRKSQFSEVVVAGIDVSDKYCHICFADEKGNPIDEQIIPTTREAFRDRFSMMRRIRIALEVGIHTSKFVRQLLDYDHDVYQANTRKVALIYKNPVKNDKNDARNLARLAALNPSALCNVRLKSEKDQLNLSVIQARQKMIEMRTKSISHIRFKAKLFGEKLPSCDADHFAAMASANLEETLKPILTPLIDQIASLTEGIKYYDREIERIAQEHYPETGLMMTVPGVSWITALAFACIVGDPDRFETPNQIGSYFGFGQRDRSSGNRIRKGGSTKHGHPLARAMLVQCAKNMLRINSPVSHINRWGLRLINKGKERNTVANGAARKLAILLVAMWRDGTVYKYEPLPREN